MTSCTVVQNRDIDGNLNVPYLYENGDKVVLNWNWLDNDWNSNDPALRFRNSLHFSPALAGEFCLSRVCSRDFESCPFQPPSIFPASSRGIERAIYFLLSKVFVSQRIIINTFKVSNLRMERRTYGNFSSLVRKTAVEIASINSMKILSILLPKEYR